MKAYWLYSLGFYFAVSEEILTEENLGFIGSGKGGGNPQLFPLCRISSPDAGFFLHENS